MPQPSLAEVVLETTSLVGALIPKIIGADGDRRDQLASAAYRALGRLEVFAERRMAKSDAEAIRRRQLSLLADIEAFVPAARGE